MSFSEELRHTLQTMGFVQLLLVLVFLGAYVLALSGLTGAVGRQRSAAVALAAAVGFAFATPAWAIGAMMMVLAVGRRGALRGRRADARPARCSPCCGPGGGLLPTKA